MTIQKPGPTKRKKGTPAKALTRNQKLWQELAAIGSSAPEKALKTLPRDFARNFDQYHDGSAPRD